MNVAHPETQSTPERSLLSTCYSPAAGWASLTRRKRHYATYGAALLAAWTGFTFALVNGAEVEGTILTTFLAGIPGMYYLARALRPYLPSANVSDIVRHWVAAIGAAAGIPVLMVTIWAAVLQVETLRGGANDTLLLTGLIGFLATMISLTWAGISILVRLLARP